MLLIFIAASATFAQKNRTKRESRSDRLGKDNDKF